MEQFSLTWRNKWLTAKAESIDDMITSLRAAADSLAEMKAAGVTLDKESGISDDYARLVTTDPAVAEKFGFEEDEDDEDETEE